MLVSYVSIADKIPLLEVVGLLTDTQSLDLRIWIQDKKKMAMVVLNVKKSFMQITRLRRTKMTDKEIVQYYGQIWGNVKHMKSYVKELRERYKKEMGVSK